MIFFFMKNLCELKKEDQWMNNPFSNSIDSKELVEILKEG